MDVIKDLPFKGVFQAKAFNLDNLTFKLFYKVTSGMLLLASLLVFADQYIGDPIECDESKTGVKDKIFEMHCWMNGARKMPGLSDSVTNGDGHPVKLQEIFKCHMKVLICPSVKRYLSKCLEIVFCFTFFQLQLRETVGKPD